jgi:hypothetical protein
MFSTNQVHRRPAICKFKTLLALLYMPLILALAQPAQSQAEDDDSGRYFTARLQILTPHPGVDLSAFDDQVLDAIRRNWISWLPDRAMHGAKGTVILGFGIQKNGTLSRQQVTVAAGANKADFAEAAVHAVRLSAPFQPLPASFAGPVIQLRAVFLYSLPIDSYRSPAGSPPVFPANDVTGNWHGQIVFPADSAPRPIALDLKLDDASLSGTFCMASCEAESSKIAFQNGDMYFGTIHFSVDTGASDLPRMDFEGDVTGDTIKFTVKGNPPDCGGQICYVAEGSAERSK